MAAIAAPVAIGIAAQSTWIPAVEMGLATIALIGSCIMSALEIWGKRDGVLTETPFIATINTTDLRGQDLRRLHNLIMDMQPSGKVVFAGPDFEVEGNATTVKVRRPPNPLFVDAVAK